MSKERWQRLSKSELAALAKKKGIAGATSLTKDKLVAALVRLAARQKADRPAKAKKEIRKPQAKKAPARKPHLRKKSLPRNMALPRSRPQLAAAHVNGNGTTAEQ